MSKEIIVIGGGAAGMMAAIAAAGQGCSVLLLERNEKLGKKLYITGKGRCNVTNACDTEEIFKQILRNAKFMYSAIYTYDNFRVMDFFGQNQVPLVTERGGRVFPASGHSSDIIRGLARELRRLGVTVRLNTRVQSVRKAAEGEKDAEESGGIGRGKDIRAGGKAAGGRAAAADGKAADGRLAVADRQDANGKFTVTDVSGRTYQADKVILATGGLSYPATGSTGDGYTFAGHFGHTVQKQYPSLVAMNTQESYIHTLQGLSLKNVRASVYDGSRKLYDDFGEMMFTHFGVSGPLILSASAIVGDVLAEKPLQLRIDLKPALSLELLDRRILRDFEEGQNKQFKNALNRLLPSTLIPAVILLSGIPPEKKVNEVTKQERKNLLDVLKGFPATLSGLRDFEEAVITRGGVSVKEIDPSTMESKLIKGLYFAGELMDVDALTGGYNLQIAWSSGYLAGMSAGEALMQAVEME